MLDYEAKVTPWEYYTPSRQYADLTLLNDLSPAEVCVKKHFETNGGVDRIVVELANRGDTVAFFIELLLLDSKTGEPLVPVFWQDNYVSLLPNETKVVSATVPAGRPERTLTVRGWNVR